MSDNHTTITSSSSSNTFWSSIENIIRPQAMVNRTTQNQIVPTPTTASLGESMNSVERFTNRLNVYFKQFFFV